MVFMVRSALSALSFLAAALSVTGLFEPPKGAITVGGRFGQYPNLTTALNNKTSDVYFIYAGTYHEQVYITRANLKIYGETLLEDTYLLNTVTFTNTLPASIAGSDDKSGTIRVHGTNVSLYNLNIINPSGNEANHSQAIALSITANQFGGYGLQIKGYQDTLYADSGTEYYANCYIEGAVDFIFGQTSSVWITDSVINSIGPGCITASGRSTNDSNWYVIQKSVIYGNQSAQAAYLGRPWHNYARVVFQENYFSDIINKTGWSIWDVGDERTNETYFAEYRNTGPGADTRYRLFDHILTQPISIDTVLPNATWIDQRYL